MKRVDAKIHSASGWTVICEYRDAFNKRWLASYPFYPWSYRTEKKDDVIKEPCHFDYNGECLICDCLYDNCAWVRYRIKDYTHESEEELNDMFGGDQTDSVDTDKI
jgi:hypothetical protein